MKKRGQLDQPFVYIFILLVIALIVIFGIQKINDVNEVKEKATYIKFQSDFQDAITNVFNKNEGTLLSYVKGSRNQPLLLPKDIKEICFEQQAARTKVIPDNLKYNDFTVDNLLPEENNFCIPAVSNTFSFKLEHKQQAVVISNAN